MVLENAEMGCVYFVHDVRAGLIKIGCTEDCPLTRLNQLRRLTRRNALELLGSIEIRSEGTYYYRTAKRELQSRFQTLRDHGDWFRPGLELVNFIRGNARPHFCSWSCPDGSSIYEERRAREERANAAFAKLVGI